MDSYPGAVVTDWQIYISPHLTIVNMVPRMCEKIAYQKKVNYRDELHLSVSMRSFRAENVSELVKQILDLDPIAARKTLSLVREKYPIVLTRNLSVAKQWLKDQARGSERYGIVVSSQAERLKPYAIHVKSPWIPSTGFWMVRRMCVLLITWKT